MSELFTSETGWLNLTNAVLGLAVIVCLLAVGRVMIQELHAWAAKRARTSIVDDDHAFNLESLGITMADGGERINELPRHIKRTAVHPDDPPNIVRSDN